MSKEKKSDGRKAAGINAGEFVQLLEKAGFNFFAGVPCSVFGDVIRILSERGYIPSVREDEALGLAAGAYMAGRRPAVFMQNSGLGTSLNVLASLHLIYKIPCLLIISWRGYAGKDAPEHLVMGRACGKILTEIGLPYRALIPERAEKDLGWALTTMQKKKIPVALFLRPGCIC